MARQPDDIVLSFDLGGTKLRAAHVNVRGQILAETKVRVRQREGFRGLVGLFREAAAQLPGTSRYRSVSVASAGPLHPEKGLLLDPTNFFTGGKSWGVLPLVRELRKVFRQPVHLENDAAAAVLGERWKGGHGRAGRNLVALTLGTGVGVGVIANDQLVRAGKGLHPEAGHIPLDVYARDYPCGCGAYGCVEAFLAGSHFARRLSSLKGRTLTGEEAVALALAGDREVSQAFRQYGLHLALAARVLAVLFAPEVIVISGGFSHAAELFLDSTRKELPKLMRRYREGIDLLPRIKVSRLQNDAGILGAAWVAARAANS